ncbi:hypothetical protein F7725_014247 [Dissostichus mawsoni]|uniref:Uncharacterized protein n=1 Tax=Dissostichus mawsoni TaxID=36200 RepID=A0A7J5YXU2_DISMA|nr:hypothetical protein F7725_014247 [Dissostichus mawsoni]
MKVRPAPAAILLFSPTSSHFRDMRHLLGRTSRRGRNTDGDQQQTSSSCGTSGHSQCSRVCSSVGQGVELLPAALQPVPVLQVAVVALGDPLGAVQETQQQQPAITAVLSLSPGPEGNQRDNVT